MHPVWIMAAINLALSVVVWGGLLSAITRRDHRYLLLALAGLPLSAVVNLAVKLPLIQGVTAASGVRGGIASGPLWYVVFIALVAPVTEELIKVAPLLIPRARRLVDRGMGGFAAGMALGIGFGIGEALFMAYNMATSFVYLGIPWYQFIGYLFERFTVAFIHGVITAVFVMGLGRGGWRAWLGFLSAVFLHLLINLPLVLRARELISPITISMVFQVTLLAMAGIFALLFRQARRASNLPGVTVEKSYFIREDEGPRF